MKLKILFAPFVIVLSVMLLIWFVWPAFQNLGKDREDLKVKQDALETIKAKKENILKMKSTLEQNSDKENFVLSYLPNRKKEEKAINSINFLAASSQVSLININIETPKEKVQEEVIQTPETSFAAATSGGTGDAQTAPLKKQIKYFTARINISGGYENIVQFTNRLNKMEFLNKIEQIKIERKDVEEGQVIAAEILADFGYLSPITVGSDFSSPIFTQTINLDLVDGIIKSMMEKAPILEEGVKGRSNPFSI